jgi:hypothetical protein
LNELHVDHEDSPNVIASRRHSSFREKGALNLLMDRCAGFLTIIIHMALGHVPFHHQSISKHNGIIKFASNAAHNLDAVSLNDAKRSYVDLKIV